MSSAGPPPPRSGSARSRRPGSCDVVASATLVFDRRTRMLRPAREGTMKKVLFVLALAAMAAVATGVPARAADVICYNCPPQWADWASMLKAIKADLGYDIPFDNKNSGQALSQLIAEKATPVADSAY